MYSCRCDDPKTQAQPTKDLPQTPWMWVPQQLSKSPERHDQSLDPHEEHGVRDTQGTHGSQQQQPAPGPRRESSSSQPPTGTRRLTGGQLAILRSKREWSPEDEHNNEARRAHIQATHGPEALRGAGSSLV